MEIFSQELIVLIVLMILGIIGYLTKQRIIRYFTLIASLGYFGFYNSDCIVPPDQVSGITGKISEFSASIPFYLKIGVIIVPAIFLGSVFCGWVCPMGAFQEIFNLGNRKGTRKDWVPEKVDDYLRYIRFVVLFFLLISPFVLKERMMNINPFSVLFGFLDIPYFPIRLMVFAGIILFVGIFLHRPWCRYFCPFGALLSLISKISIFKIKLTDEDSCIGCSKCEKACDIGAIKMENKKPNIIQERCIRCGECILPCPKQGLNVCH